MGNLAHVARASLQLYCHYADGIYSTVRGLTLGSIPPGYTGVMIWRSLAPSRPRGVTNLMVLLGEGCFFGLVPMGDGHSYGFGGVGEPRFPDPLEGRFGGR